METLDYRYFILFHEAILHHKAELSLNSLSKNPNKTLLLKDLVTVNNNFNESLFEFIYWLISDGNREIFFAKKCKLRFTHSQSNRNLMKVLFYADSKCKLVEEEKDWSYKTMSIWKNKYEAIILKNFKNPSNQSEKKTGLSRNNSTSSMMELSIRSERGRSMNRTDSFNSRSTSLTRNIESGSNASSPSVRIRKEPRSANPSPNKRIPSRPSTPSQMRKFKEMLELTSEEYEQSAMNYRLTSGQNTPKSRSQTPSDFGRVKSVADLNAEEYELSALNYNCDSGSHLSSQISSKRNERRRMTASPGHRRSRSISGKEIAAMFEGEDLSQEPSSEVKKKILSKKEKMSEKKEAVIGNFSNYNFTSEEDIYTNNNNNIRELESSPPPNLVNNINDDINQNSAADEYARYIAESMAITPSGPTVYSSANSVASNRSSSRSCKSENSTEKFKNFEFSIKSLADDLLATASSSDSPLTVPDLDDTVNLSSNCIITTRKKNAFSESDELNNNKEFVPISSVSMNNTYVFNPLKQQPLSNASNATKSNDIFSRFNNSSGVADDYEQKRVSPTKEVSPQQAISVQQYTNNFDMLLNNNNDVDEEEEEEEKEEYPCVSSIKDLPLSPRSLSKNNSMSFEQKEDSPYISPTKQVASPTESSLKNSSMIFNRSYSEEKEDDFHSNSSCNNKSNHVIALKEEIPVQTKSQHQTVNNTEAIVASQTLNQFDSWINSNDRKDELVNNYKPLSPHQTSPSTKERFNNKNTNYTSSYKFSSSRFNPSESNNYTKFDVSHLSNVELPLREINMNAISLHTTGVDAFTVAKVNSVIKKSFEFKRKPIPGLKEKSAANLIKQLNLQKLFPRVSRSLIPLQIVYDNNNNNNVKFGNMINKSIINNAPSVYFDSNVDNNALTYHTLILSELDGVGRETIRWIIIQIPNNNVSSGLQIIPYNIPANKDSDIHRYVFSLYKQEQSFSAIEISAVESMFRIHTTTTSNEWIQDMQGKIIEAPIAINAFVSYEDIENQESFKSFSSSNHSKDINNQIIDISNTMRNQLLV